MIIEKRISFETAKLAKEKGFNDYICSTDFYTPDGALLCNDFQYSEFSFLAPKQELLKQWLRNKYHLYVRVATNSLTCHFPMIELVDVDGTQLRGPVYIKNYQTYEEALEVGLESALKLINLESGVNKEN